MSTPMFIFGGNTGVATPQQLKRLRAVAEALNGNNRTPRNLGEGLSAIGEALLYRSTIGRADKMEEEGRASASSAMDPILKALGGDTPSPAETSKVGAALMGEPGAAKELAASDPAPDVSNNGSTFAPFIDTVKTGIKLDDGSTRAITNPYGLAAVAATGKAESGWSPKNANGSWSDPSESGQAGTAGGVMSWRAERLANLQAYAASKGEKGNGSPQTQAEFLLKEDPNLIAGLNAAKSTEEAQRLMNNAWKFAGYDRPGGEAARRMSLANAYAPQFQGGNEVASLDPSAGMPSAAAAIELQAPRSGAVAPPPPQFNAGRFSDPIKLSEMPAGQGDMAARLSAQGNAYSAQPQPPQAPAGALPPLPSREVGPEPQVAAVPPQQAAPAAAAPMRVAQAQTGPNLGQLYTALQNPWLSEGQRDLIVNEIQRRQQEADPVRQMQIQKLQREINAPVKRDTSVVNGRLVDNQTGKVIAEYPDEAKPTADRQNYEFYRDFEVKNGRTPLGPLEWEQAQRKAGASTTSVTVGEGDKFYENLDRKNAETFAAMSDAGIQARGRLGQIDRLEGLFSNVPQGIEGGFKKLAGDWGIPVGDSTSDIQAASALIEKMVPEQRPPGSGTMSDADIKMFRNSLPKILNQPGGNELIFQTMRGIAQYEEQMGEIADAVADRAITPAEGRKRIRELKNPLADFKIPDGPTPNAGTKQTRTGVQWSID